MRQALALWVVFSVGCSFLYDPGKLPAGANGGISDAGDALVDASVDASVDAALTPDAGCPPRALWTESGCMPARRVFLSSTTSDAGFGTVDLADAHCQGLADAQQLGGSWKAWLSSSSVSVASRFTKSTVDPYVLLDGTQIGDDFDDLIDETLDARVRLTETLEEHATGEVWTGTDGDGSAFVSSTCSNWENSTDSTPHGVVGLLQNSDNDWTAAYEQFCDRTEVRLYCFEQ